MCAGCREFDCWSRPVHACMHMFCMHWVEAALVMYEMKGFDCPGCHRYTTDKMVTRDYAMDSLINQFLVQLQPAPARAHKYNRYPDFEQREEAIDDAREFGVAAAARKHNMPETTLKYWVDHVDPWSRSRSRSRSGSRSSHRCRKYRGN